MRATPLRIPVLGTAACALATIGLLAASCGSPAKNGKASGLTGALHAAPIASAPSGFFPGFQSQVYSNQRNWLCLPGESATRNACDIDLSYTSVAPDGSKVVTHAAPTFGAKFDCFYVYPTVDTTNSANAPLSGSHASEVQVVRTQVASLGSQCNLYAPLYRQVTVFGLADTAPDAANRFQIAYSDVLDSFKYYLAHFNGGRPFVLIGHSQGSGLLVQLAQQLIDGDPALRARMISMIVPGATINVPIGALVGDTFKNIPGCSTGAEIGCVIGYSTFKASDPPPPDAIFGKGTDPGTQDLCVNPAALADQGESLDSEFYLGRTPGASAIFSQSGLSPTSGRKTTASIKTKFVRFPDYVDAKCTYDGRFSYLSVSMAHPTGLRTTVLPSSLPPSWGLHVLDLNLSEGTLDHVVGQEAAAWLADNHG